MRRLHRSRSFACWLVASLAPIVLGCAGARHDAPRDWEAVDRSVSTADSSVSSRAGGSLVGLWSRRAGRCLMVAPAATDSLLVTVSTDGRVQAWNASDGERRWARRFKAPVDVAPTLGRTMAGDLVVVSPRGKGQGLTALSATTGRTVWQMRLDRAVVRLEACDTLLLVQDRGGELSAHSLRDGHEIWSRSVGGWDSPAFLRVQRRLFIAAREDSVTALEAESGVTVWRVMPGDRFVVSPVLCGERLAVAGEGGRMVWLHAADGGLVGRSRRADPQVAPGVARGERLLTVSGGGVAELAGFRESPEDWSRDLECAVVAPPVLVEGRLFVATALGALRTLEPESGRSLGVSQSRAGFRVAPFTAGTRLVLADDKGYLHAYRY